MKIKVAIIDSDENYKNRLLSNFQIKYADKIELYAFSSIDQIESLNLAGKIDVVLLDGMLEIPNEEFLKSTVVVYFGETMDIDEKDGIPVICKFQKIETLYKQILSIYAETAGNINMKSKGTSANIVLFTSAQGGSGTSSAAAAYALYHALHNKNVFYLNLEQFGGADVFFTGNGGMSFSDVIYALKTKKSNLFMKLESAMKTDKSGVDFFDISKNAYDMIEFKDEEIGRLIQGITQIKDYDEIVVDFSGSFGSRMLMLMQEYATKIVCVSDGSLSGNQKFVRFCDALRVIEQKEEKKILNKMVLLYSRYSSKTSRQLSESAIQVIGGIHRYEGITGRELIEQISKTAVIEKV